MDLKTLKQTSQNKIQEKAIIETLEFSVKQKQKQEIDYSLNDILCSDRQNQEFFQIKQNQQAKRECVYSQIQTNKFIEYYSLISSYKYDESNKKNSNQTIQNYSQLRGQSQLKREIKQASIKYQESFQNNQQINIIKKPKKAPNSYILFRAEIRTKILQTESKFRQAELNQIVAQKWRNLSLQQKKPYEDQSNKLRKQYMEKIKIYRQMKEKSQVKLDVLTNNKIKKTNKLKKNKCKKIKKLLKLLQKQIQDDKQLPINTRNNQFQNKQPQRSLNQRIRQIRNFKKNKSSQKLNLNEELRNFLKSQNKQLKKSSNKQRAMSQIEKYLQDQSFINNPIKSRSMKNQSKAKKENDKYLQTQQQKQIRHQYYLPYYYIHQPQLYSQYQNYQPQIQQKRRLLLQPQFNQQHYNLNSKNSNKNTNKAKKLSKKLPQAQIKKQNKITQTSQILSKNVIQKNQKQIRLKNKIPQTQRQTPLFKNEQNLFFFEKRQDTEQKQKKIEQQKQIKSFEKEDYNIQQNVRTKDKRAVKDNIFEIGGEQYLFQSEGLSDVQYFGKIKEFRTVNSFSIQSTSDRFKNMIELQSSDFSRSITSKNNENIE